ncbi:MAG: hypothetical protein EZS28_001829 [Streblomastix strix]|uniref:Uncharacterized protein n=1 Tax=Streblomastix strix TaxID=222440 RepID=A0A5J4X613_9EUKA|nr:MAG: hypothetical protein EZS28_001829 [Streblomastix strix]
MLARGLKLRKGMTTADKRVTEDEIIRIDTSIRPVDATAGVLGLKDHKALRTVYGPGFPSRSRRLVVTEEQQLNQLFNFGSHRQKEKESQSLNQQFPIESQEDLGQSSMFQDQPPEITVAQEKLTEKQRQVIQKDILKSENLNTVYDIGALDWCRPPINDIYNRNPFETHKTGYKYDALGNPQAYMKIDTPVGSKKQTKMKKNYISTSQLVSTSTAYEKLAQNLSGKPQKKKAKN